MGQFTDRVLNELKDIKQKQAEHTTQLTINNHILNEHHVRASQLESRIKPIETHVDFQRRLSKLFASLVALAAAVATIVKLSH